MVLNKTENLNTINNFVTVIVDDVIIGHKNINCPNYEKCLDKHCQKNAEYWICNNCRYEQTFIKESQILREYRLFTDYFEKISKY